MIEKSLERLMDCLQDINCVKTMTTLFQNFYFQIYHTNPQIFLFDCLLPLHQQKNGKERFTFFYSTSYRRGCHIKIYFHFDEPIERENFLEQYIKPIEQYLSFKPSQERGILATQNPDLFMNFPNNSIHEFVFDAKQYFTENEKIADSLLAIYCKYTHEIMMYRENFDTNMIFASGIIISDAIISSFFKTQFEKQEFFNWLYQDQVPNANFFSLKDKDVRKSVTKVIRQIEDNRRRSFNEQKKLIKNLIEQYEEADLSDSDFPWLNDFRNDLVIFNESLKERNYTVPDKFIYQANTKTSFKDQEKWPIIETIVTTTYSILGMDSELLLDCIYSLKEYFKEVENLVETV
jgi:hypothetical protein